MEIEKQQSTVAELKQQLAAAEAQEREKNLKIKTDFINEGDILIDNIVDEYIGFNENMKAFKEMKTEAVLAYDKKTYEILGKKWRPSKTVTLYNSNRDKKIVAEEADKLDFNNQAIVHINAIRDILKEKFKDQSELYDFIDSILVKNKFGDYDPRLLAKAKQKAQKLNDPDLISEFEQLGNCQIVVGISKYIRAYIKDANGKFQNISINYSSL